MIECGSTYSSKKGLVFRIMSILILHSAKSSVIFEDLSDGSPHCPFSSSTSSGLPLRQKKNTMVRKAIIQSCQTLCMTIEKAREMLQGVINRQKNVIERMEKEGQPEVNINPAKLEAETLEDILKELENP